MNRQRKSLGKKKRCCACASGGRRSSKTLKGYPRTAILALGPAQFLKPKSEAEASATPSSSNQPRASSCFCSPFFSTSPRLPRRLLEYSGRPPAAGDSRQTPHTAAHELVVLPGRVGMETEGVRAGARASSAASDGRSVDDGEGSRRRGREEPPTEAIAGAGRVQVPASKKRYKTTGTYAELLMQSLIARMWF